MYSHVFACIVMYRSCIGHMYRSCIGHVSTVLTCIVMYRRSPYIAGPIHDRYMGIFFCMYRSFFACMWMASPIRTDT